MEPLIFFLVWVQFIKGGSFLPVFWQKGVNEENEVGSNLDSFLFCLFSRILPKLIIVLQKEIVFLVSNLIEGVCLSAQKKENDSQSINIVLDEGELLAGNRLRCSVFSSAKTRFFWGAWIWNIIIIFILWFLCVTEVNNFEWVIFCKDDVFQFQVSVADFFFIHVSYSLNQHSNKSTAGSWWKRSTFIYGNIPKQHWFLCILHDHHRLFLHLQPLVGVKNQFGRCHRFSICHPGTFLQQLVGIPFTVEGKFFVIKEHLNGNNFIFIGTQVNTIYWM